MQKELELGATSRALKPVPMAKRDLFLSAGCRLYCRIGVNIVQKEKMDVYHDDRLVYSIPWHEIEPSRHLEEDGTFTFDVFPDDHDPWRAAAEAIGRIHEAEAG